MIFVFEFTFFLIVYPFKNYLNKKTKRFHPKVVVEKKVEKKILYKQAICRRSAQKMLRREATQRNL